MKKHKNELRSTLLMAEKMIEFLQDALKDLEGDDLNENILAYSFISSMFHCMKLAQKLSSIGVMTGIAIYKNKDSEFSKYLKPHSLFRSEDEDEETEDEDEEIHIGLGSIDKSELKKILRDILE